jgi:hypothetical protein
MAVSKSARLLRQIARVAILVGGVSLAGGCLSPTLPLPPPDVPGTIASAADGVWAIQGTCIPGAQVTVLNEVTGKGEVFVDLENTGRYNVELHATLCDFVTVSQEAHNEESSKTGFIIEPVMNGAASDPSLCGN